MYQAGPLLYRQNERAKVQLGVIRQLPHEANLLHVYFDMQVRRVCKALPAGHLRLRVVTELRLQSVVTEQRLQTG
jgi:hypothetical protein